MYMLWLKNPRNKNKKALHFEGKIPTKEEARKEELLKIKSMSKEEYFKYRQRQAIKKQKKKAALIPRNNFLYTLAEELEQEREN